MEPSDTLSLFATAAKGTEGLLRDELREGRFRRVKATRGGVAFEGTLSDALRACLELRIAQRVLVRLREFPCTSANELYEGCAAIPWFAWTSTRKTFAVRVEGRAEGLVHSGFAALRVKDAIVDTFRARSGARPSVDREAPEFSVFVLLKDGLAMVYADASGEPLFKRGYRSAALEAPLKETLAAAIVRWSGYRGDGDFIDPMCGSGTLAIEAGMLARSLAPGLARAAFAVETFEPFGDAERRFARHRRQELVEASEPTRPLRLLVADSNPAACDLAQRNASRVGLELLVRTGSLETIELPRPEATIVTNPPYGERLASSAPLLHGLERLMELDWRSLHVLAGAPFIEAAFRPRPSRWLALSNGDLPVRLLSFER